MSRIFKVKVNGKSYDVEVEEVGSSNSEQKIVQEDSTESKPITKNEQPKPAPKKEEPKPAPKKEEPKTVPAESSSSDGEKEILAPLPGVVIDIKVKVGDKVTPGDKLMIIEAMKMENEIPSEFSGIVDKILVNKGDNVDGDEPVIILK
ncbi:MAG: biotin/lipoyl-containing protein [Thermotogota bacterium]